MRPLSEGYPTYIDGIGMTLTGQRWAKYCSRCRDYWERQSTGNMPSQLGEQPSWLFALPTRSPDSLGLEVPGQPNRHSVETEIQPSQAQPWPPNPFGTREEIASEDWESPLTSMFSRAWNRFREAENARHRLEREMEEQLLPQIASGSPTRSSALREELRHIQNLAREMASGFSQTHSALNPGQLPPSSSPPRVNPIDEQSRPPGLTSSDMVVSIACRICNEQRIDTLMEPWPPVILAFPPSPDLEGDPMQIDGKEESVHSPTNVDLLYKPGPDRYEPVSRISQANETKGRHRADYQRLLEYLFLSSFGGYAPPALDLLPAPGA
ncbi:hypothetical protein DV735_g2254, partial [Chaetothyriales sp. CBS 134920]